MHGVMRARWLWTISLASAMSAVPAGQGRGAPVSAQPGIETATFAGGCFWSMVHVFDGVPGVVSVVAGYTGGSIAHPSYSQVSSGGTGHAEAVQVQFDPKRIAYPALLHLFWRNVDPLDATGQFCDRGEQYRSEIFYHDSSQMEAADASERAVVRSGHLRGPIVTQIVPAGPFYAAEAYHQGYYQKHPIAYAIYRWGCGRDRRLHQIWGTDAAAGDGPSTEG
jgi:peptide-methionine (S)-S-oxide reductase